MDESTKMPEDPLADEKLREWASEWADRFDQSWDAARLGDLVGALVSGRVDTAEGPKGFESVVVVGYSIDTLVFSPEEGAETETVTRASLLTADGKQLSILSGMQVVEISVE